MAWVRLDDGFTEHPKVVRAGPMAAWLYVCGLTYCARNLTDGVLPNEQISRLLPTRFVHSLAQKLVEVGLWEASPDGYVIHDYLIYNASREQTLALRQQKAEAGRKGGWQKASNVLADRQASGTTPVPKPQPVPIERPQENGASPRIPTHVDAPRRRVRVEDDQDFDLWYRAYPRHEAKIAARKSYRARRTAGRSPEALLAAAEQFREHVELARTPPDKIPLPTTFLNQGRDEDWEHGPPEAGRAPSRPKATASLGVEKYFPDYRSAAQKAVEPVRQWRESNWREETTT